MIDKRTGKLLGPEVVYTCYKVDLNLSQSYSFHRTQNHIHAARWRYFIV